MTQLLFKSTFTVLLAVLFFVNSAFAFGFHSRHGFHHGDSEKRSERMVEYFADELELDTVQKATLRQIKDDLLAKRKELKLDKKALFDSYLTELDKDAFDRNKFQIILDEHAAKVKLETGFFTNKLIAFHEMLSPVQRDLVVAKIKEKQQRREDRKKSWFYKTPEARADQVLNIISDKLDLTEEQFGVFSTLKNNLLMERNRQLPEAFFKNTIELLSNDFRSETLDANKIQNQMNLTLSKFQNMLSAVLINLEKAHRILTPEQRAEVKEKMLDHQTHFTRH